MDKTMEYSSFFRKCRGACEEGSNANCSFFLCSSNERAVLHEILDVRHSAKGGLSGGLKGVSKPV